MKFEEAMKAMREGDVVRRQAFFENSKDQTGVTLSRNDTPRFVRVLPTWTGSCVRIGDFVPGASDILAEDWKIVWRFCNHVDSSR